MENAKYSCHVQQIKTIFPIKRLISKFEFSDQSKSCFVIFRDQNAQDLDENGPTTKKWNLLLKK